MLWWVRVVRWMSLHYIRKQSEPNPGVEPAAEWTCLHLQTNNFASFFNTLLVIRFYTPSREDFKVVMFLSNLLV